MGKWDPGAQGSKKPAVGTEWGNKNPENKTKILDEKENILLAGLLFPCGRSYQRVLDSNYWGTRSKWLSSANTKYLFFRLKIDFPDVFLFVWRWVAYFRCSAEADRLVAGTGYLCLNILTYSRDSGQGWQDSRVASDWSISQILASDWLAVTSSWHGPGGREAEKCQERRFFARDSHWRNWSSEKYTREPLSMT